VETTLYLMRHGEVHNPEQILYGRMPNYYLSETGKQQAHSAGRWLKGKNIDAIYCSPMERAQQTAGIVAEYQDNLIPQIDERIIEVHTPYDGRPVSELEAMGWDLYTGNEPPYEVPMMILDRVHNFFDFIIEQHKGESVVAVGHGDILVFPWLDAQGVIPEARMKDTLLDYNLPEIYPATASIMTFTFTDSPRHIKPKVAYIRPY
jgi:broad specificity phosphatase PhoE